MPLHVDVVKVDWGKGTQTQVARVSPIDGDVKVDGQYEDVIRRPYTDRKSGKLLEPTSDPERFVEQLHTVMGGGSYLVATELHDDGSCPFRDTDTLALEAGSGTQTHWP